MKLLISVNVEKCNNCLIYDMILIYGVYHNVVNKLLFIIKLPKLWQCGVIIWIIIMYILWFNWDKLNLYV